MSPKTSRTLTWLSLLGFVPYLQYIATQWTDYALDDILPGPMVLGLIVLLLAREGRPRALDDEDRPAGGRLLAGAALVSALCLALSLLGRPIAGAALLPIALGFAVWNGFGAEALSRRAMPISLLFFVPPIPMSVRLALQPSLARFAARFAAALATLAGYAPTRDGIIVRTPEFFIEVIDSCSGLYMVIMFLIVAVTLVALRRLRGPRAAAMIAAATPLGLFLNAIRLATILILGHHDPETMAAKEMAHDAPGVILFALGVLILALIGGRGQKTSPPVAAAPSSAPPSSS